jgi:hypothetical protein
MSIAPNSVAVPAQSKSLDTSTVTTAAGLVHRQVISLADPENQGQYARLTGNALNVQVVNTSLAITAAALPLPSGAATSAKQPALGTAGMPSEDVITVQGVAGGTALPNVRRGGSYVHLDANGTTTVKALAGTLQRVVINKKGSSGNTLTIYDNTAASGAVIAIIDPTSDAGCTDYGLRFDAGLTVVLAGGTAADITIIFE